MIPEQKSADGKSGDDKTVKRSTGALSPRVAWLSPDGIGSTIPAWLQHKSQCCSAPEELLKGPGADVVVVDGFVDAGPILQQLRSQPHDPLRLIYLTGENTPLAASLADGPLPDAEAGLIQAWSHWQERYKLFNRGRPPEKFSQLLLCWLWQRSEATVVPVRDPDDREVYRYPLVEALAGDRSVNAWSFLQQMQQNNQLDAGDLSDRLRQCTHCNSSRLNYVDVCPECRLLDIVRQPSLHCFICGHVAPQQDFLRGENLVCPNCLNQLRHIGSDYDRPIENYRCRTNGHFFVDAEVDVFCFDCGQRHTPEQLRVREIRPYRLSDAGRLACRQGLEDGSVTAQYLRRLKLVSQADFLEDLNWQLTIARRYGPPKGSTMASVLGMKLENLERVMEEAGEVMATAMLESLMERLQQVIRDTDRCMRGREDVLWILLPQTPAQGLNRLQERLVEGMEDMGGTGETRIQLRFVGCVLPEQAEKQEDAPLLLARLAGDLS